MRGLTQAIRLPLLALLIGLALPLPVSAQGLDTSAIDGLIKEALQTWQVPGASVAIVHNERVVYLKGFGVRDLTSRKPVTADTLFPLASCSKAFTSTAVAMLVDEGKMDWDDPVRKHVEFFRLADPLADANVTIRDLMCHRTGVGSNDMLWYRSPWPIEDMIRRIGRVKPNKSFRSTFQYQSTMFTTAGYAVGVASRSSWPEFVHKRIFDPLGMKHAYLTLQEASPVDDRAGAHRKNDQGKVEGIPWYPFDRPEPAGSVITSARELTKWMTFQLGDGAYRGKRLVSADNLNETHSPQIALRMDPFQRTINPFTHLSSYGLAWLIQDYRGHLLVSHGGAIDGFRAIIMLVPRAKLGIAILSNLQGNRMNISLCNNLLDLLLGVPAQDWNAYFAELVKQEEEAVKAHRQNDEARRHKNTKPSQPLQAYTGTFTEPAYGTSRIVLKDGGLVWEWRSFQSPLEHYHYDTFTAKNDHLGDPRVVFSLGADGAVKKMSVFEVEFKK